MQNQRRVVVIVVAVVVLAVLFFNARFLGFAVSNDTTSNVTVGGPNTAPSIVPFATTIQVCERSSLFYLFNATDADADALTATLVPSDPFFVLWYAQTTPNNNQFALISGTLDKNDLGGTNVGSKLYEETVTVDDDYNATCCTDSQKTNITIIEKNNVPSVDNIGVQTIWNQGANATFYYDWAARDIEFTRGYGALTYAVTIVNATSGDPSSLFSIGATGVMNFTANATTTLGVYNVSACVTDTVLTNTHVNISSVCGQDGSARTVCDNFSLTVTDENRAPQFLDYWPTTFSLSTGGTTTLSFNITKYDPDGTIPDSYWYIDDVLSVVKSGSSVDYFSHVFGCGVSGNHTVRVVITDGKLNDSLQWNYTVSEVSCAPPSTGGGSSGGGGGGGASSVGQFVVTPEFITTSLFQEQGKTFDLVVNNTGETKLDFVLDMVNVSDFSILSDEAFSLTPGGTRTVKLYLYALRDTPQGVYFGSVVFRAGGITQNVPLVLEVKEREPLFDVKVRVPREYKTVYAGDEVRALVDMLNVGLYGTAVDVELYLVITDLDKILLYETQKEVIAVETNQSVERTLFVPETTPAGTYLVLGEAKYNNITVSTYDTFSVVERKYVRASYLIILFIVLALIFFIFFILYKRRKDRKERGYR